jgi:hypothetical protein
LPNYSQSSAALPITGIRPGDRVLSFNAETPTPPQAGQAFSICQLGPGTQPKGLNLEIAFSTDPGAFQVDLQEADTDVDGAYITLQSITAVNASFYGRIDNAPFTAQFVRAKLVSRTNAVSLTAKITVAP